MLEGAVGASLLDALLLVEPFDQLITGVSCARVAVLVMRPEAVGEWFGVAV